MELSEIFDTKDKSYHYTSLIRSNFVSIDCRLKAGMYRINGIVNGHLKKKIGLHGKGFSKSIMTSDDRKIYFPNTDNYYVGFARGEMIVDKIILQTDIIPLYYKGKNFLDLCMDLPEADKPGRVYRLFYIQGLEMTVILMGIGHLQDITCMTIWVDSKYIYLVNCIENQMIILDQKNDLEPIFEIEYKEDKDSRVCEFLKPRILASKRNKEFINYHYDPQGILISIDSSQNNYEFHRDQYTDNDGITHINLTYPIHVQKAFGCFLLETEENLFYRDEEILLEKDKVISVERSLVARRILQ